MQNQQPRRLLPPVAIAGITTLLIATAGGAAWWTWKTHSTSTVPPALEHAQPKDSGTSMAPDGSNTQQSPGITATIPATNTLQVYWLKPSNTSIQLAPSAVKLTSTNTPDVMLTTAMQELLAGPSQTDISTTIPAGTQLLALSVKPDGVHVNLSRQFTTGGGSTSMTGRLAQVLYTATSLDPNTPMWLEVEGKPLKTLGGEGLIVDQPVTRKQFEKDFPL